ncbi:MAG: heparinase II/III domain-containing protein [Eubacteriales bacterium]|jgi:hypothetical protein
MTQIFTAPLPPILPLADFRPFLDLPDACCFSALSSETRTALVKAADECPPIPILPASDYARFVKDGNRTEYERPYFLRRKRLMNLALGQKIEPRFANALADTLWAILEETSWVLPAHNKKRDSPMPALPFCYCDDVDNIDLFSAETAAAIALVVYLCRDALDEVSPQIMNRTLYELERRIFRPYLRYNDMWWMGETGSSLNNWTPWIVSSVLTAMAVMLDDDARRREIAEKSGVILDRFLTFYTPDGGCSEGPSYWSVAGASFFDCLELYYDLTGGQFDAFSVPLVREMGAYIMRVHIAGERFLNFADAPAKLRPSGAFIRRYGRRTGNAQLTAFGAMLDTNAPDNTNGKLNRAGTPFRAVKNLWEPTTPTEPYTPEAVTWLPDLGVLRLSRNGFTLGAKAGCNGESHNHNDVGSFLLFDGDHPVLIDGGVGTYSRKTFSAERYTIWTMRSSYHNLPTIGGVEQREGREYAARDVSFDGQTLSMDLAGAYPESAGIIRWTRTLTLDDAGAVVTDDYTLSEPKPVAWTLMLADRPTLKDGCIEVSGCAVTYDLPLTAAVEEIPLDDEKLAAAWDRDKLYRVRLTGTPDTSGRLTMHIKRV